MQKTKTKKRQTYSSATY